MLQLTFLELKVPNDLSSLMNTVVGEQDTIDMGDKDQPNQQAKKSSLDCL